ncbi:hypothetical protein HHI36_018773 [Cryptolaemus montrouzieri]|uniref:N-terminal Ras-GEF domain-containing protein n=1 Tax=Cryptolaemus montrouzieri TaxID=559131 RepID=A0ABD2P1N2_9CUCU
MDDPEIQETVESILGKGVKVVDCEKKSAIKEEEVLYINGMPVALEGNDGLAIKQALVTGQVPPCDLLNTLLIKTGILKAPVKLDTSLSVKSTTVTKEEVTVSREGKIIDERSRETKEHNVYTSAYTEVYEPIAIIPSSQIADRIYNANNRDKTGKYQDSTGYETESSDVKFGSSSSASSYESDSAVPPSPYGKHGGSNGSNETICRSEYSRKSLDDPINMNSLDETDFLCNQFSKGFPVQYNGKSNCRNEFGPTIFGTVASDHTVKDGPNRRCLPQTPHTKSFSSTYIGESTPENTDDPSVQLENTLVYRDGNLLSGSLDALIQHMVPTDVYYPDRAYIFAFLLSSRLFIKPHDLLAKMRNLYEIQQGLSSS